MEKYVLEHENGARAIVDTKTATCISWVDQNGVQVIGNANTVHMFPNSKTPLGGHFVPGKLMTIIIHSLVKSLLI